MRNYPVLLLLALAGLLSGSFHHANADQTLLQNKQSQQSDNKAQLTLQLKWEHEFQFAGYYAAQWQGYYQDEGLDVEIVPITRPDGSVRIPLKELLQGNADFAIGALDIVIGLDRGDELAILAPIFQNSPNALYSLKDTPIDSLAQLAKLKIAVTGGSSTQAEILAMFKSRGYDLDKIQFVSEPVTVQTLIDGKADVISTYSVSARRQAAEQGVTLNEFNPSDYGIHFFSDTLYTTRQQVQSNPKRVQKFVDATIKGWHYALNHQQQIAKRISETLPRHLIKYDDFYEYNMDFANSIDDYLDYPQIPLGTINKDRWFTMNEKLRAIGMVGTQLTSDAFYTPSKSHPLSLAPVGNQIAVAIILLFLVFVLWYRRYLVLTLICLVAFMALSGFIIEHTIKQQQLQQTRLDLNRRLTSVAALLKGNLQSHLSTITGFSAYISAHPNLTKQEFTTYAKEVLSRGTLMLNIAAAKDLVVNYIYPKQGNEKALGLNYRQNEAQRDAALHVAKTGQLLIVGPVQLVQGGVAFIARAPVYTGDGSNRKLWGIVSAPIDKELLYQYSGIKKISKELNLAIKTFNNFDHQGKLIYGQRQTFSHPTQIQQVIAVGAGTWRLALAPKADNAYLSRTVLLSRILMLFLTVFFCVFVLFRFKQDKERTRFNRQLKKNEQLLQNVGKVARIGGWQLSKDLKFENWSTHAQEILNKTEHSLPTTSAEFAQILSNRDADTWQQSIERLLHQQQSFEIDIELPTSNDNPLWVRMIANPPKNDGENLSGTIQDVTQKILDAKLIKHQATFDALTDLPNRSLFNDRLEQAIEHAKRKQKKLAVLFIDLDRFKPVNDNYGHQIGDKLLIEAARRIIPCVRASDTVSRLSGDEFGVILEEISENSNALKIIEQIMNNMQITYFIDDISIHCSASIGVAFYPDDAQEADALIRKADQAMYAVKSSGRNGWQVFTQEMQVTFEYRHQLLTELIDAVNDKLLIPYYQPIFDMKTLKPVKTEVLCRWQKADGHFVSPAEFIAIAEESGLINKIDTEMLKLSKRNLAALNTPIELSINVSPRLFTTKDRALEVWLETIKEANKEINITVEITERLITNDTQRALNILKKLKRLGIKIAIDDFGTGYSSLSYLLKFPVDIIKIDKSFVEAIGTEKSSETLITTVIAMAQELDIKVIAEGIETQAQLEFLQTHQCDMGQGFFLSKPMPESEFNHYIRHP